MTKISSYEVCFDKPNIVSTKVKYVNCRFSFTSKSVYKL